MRFIKVQKEETGSAISTEMFTKRFTSFGIPFLYVTNNEKFAEFLETHPEIVNKESLNF